MSCSPSAFARGDADFYITNLPDVGGDSYRVEVLDQPLGDLFRHVFQTDTGKLLCSRNRLSSRRLFARIPLTCFSLAAILPRCSAPLRLAFKRLAIIKFALFLLWMQSFSTDARLLVRPLLRVCSNPRPTRSLPLALFNVNH